MSKDAKARNKPGSSTLVKNEKIRIFVETYCETKLALNIHMNDTIQTIKNKIRAFYDIPLYRVKLVFRDEELRDMSKVSDYNIKNGSTLKLLLHLRGGPITSDKRSLHLECEFMKRIVGLMKKSKDDDVPVVLISNKQIQSLIDVESNEEDSELDISDHDGSRVSSSACDDTKSNYTTHVQIVGNYVKVTKSKNTFRRMQKQESERTSFKKQLENKITMKKMNDLRVRLKNLSVNEMPVEAPLDDYVLISDNNSPSVEVENVSLLNKEEHSAAAPIHLLSPMLRKSASEVCISQSVMNADSSINREPVKYYSIDETRSRDNILNVLDNMLECDEVGVGKSPVHRPVAKYMSKETPADAVEFADSGKLSSSKLKVETTPSDVDDVSCVTTPDLSSDESDIPSRIVARRGRKTRGLPTRRRGLLELCQLFRSDEVYFLPTSKSMPNVARISLSFNGRKRWTKPWKKQENESRKEKGVTLPPILPVGAADEKVAEFEKEKKIKKNRCFHCRKKLHIAATYTCRCKQLFCPSHRYSETHSCTFDYRKEGQEIIRKNNPLVVAEKLPKI